MGQNQFFFEILSKIESFRSFEKKTEMFRKFRLKSKFLLFEISIEIEIFTKNSLKLKFFENLDQNRNFYRNLS